MAEEPKESSRDGQIEPEDGASAKIDAIDRKILEILLEDSRVSYTELSKAVNLSRVRVRERVRRLQEIGVIERFTVLVRSKYLGRPLPAFFDIAVSSSSVEEAARRIAEHPDIVIVYQMTGRSALHVHGFFAHIEEVSDFVNHFLVGIPGITSVDTQFLLRRYKVQRSLMV